jgi:penicillin-binding protein 1C
VRSAAPLWASIMHELLMRNDHPLNPPSGNLVRREICVTTGLLPSRFSAGKATELFLKGTEPQQDSASWFSDEGKLLLSGEYAAWCASRDNTLGAAVVPEPRITNPLPNTKYEIDPVLPRTQQMIELTATIGGDVRWTVNGVPVLPQRDGRFFWQLAKGEWELRATGRNGAAQEKITVE